MRYELSGAFRLSGLDDSLLVYGGYEPVNRVRDDGLDRQTRCDMRFLPAHTSPSAGNVSPSEHACPESVRDIDLVCEAGFVGKALHVQEESEGDVQVSIA